MSGKFLKTSPSWFYQILMVKVWIVPVLERFSRGGHVQLVKSTPRLVEREEERCKFFDR